MGERDDGANAEYVVLVNDEEQHALQRADLHVPNGWRKVFGPSAPADCRTYVDEHWTDMRPLSLRKAMDAHT
jgi:MbtH protein